MNKKTITIVQAVLLALAVLAAIVSLPENIAGTKLANASGDPGNTNIKPYQGGVVSGEIPKAKDKKPAQKSAPSVPSATPKASVKCDIDCKKKALVKAGITPALASSIISNCKDSARDPVHCIKYAASVAGAESSGGNRCHNNGCFGIKSGRISYESLDVGVADWVRRYNKYWYKATGVHNFYPARGQVSKFRYCTSEASSNSSVGCPNGLKHSSSVFTSLSQSF